MLSSHDLNSVHAMINHSNEAERGYLKEHAVMEIDVIYNNSIINNGSCDRFLTEKECRALDLAMETIAQLNSSHE